MSYVYRLIEIFLYLLFYMLHVSTSAYAQELEPRTYANTPIGINWFTVGYGYSSGNVLLDPALPVEDLDGKMNIGILGYGRTFSLLNRNAKLKIFVPYAFGDWQGNFEGDATTREARGFGDFRAKLEWNFYGAPALSGAKYQSYQQKTIIGTSILIVAPTSDYNSDKLLNLGSNRWSIRTELGVSRAIGKWTVEFAGNVSWFNDNNNYFGGNTLSQDPLYVAKTHLIYKFRPGMWLGGSLGYGRGGQSFINGEPRANEQKNLRYGMTFAYSFNQQHGIRASYTAAENSGAGTEFDAFGLGYKYAWGAL